MMMGISDEKVQLLQHVGVVTDGGVQDVERDEDMEVAGCEEVGEEENGEGTYDGFEEGEWERGMCVKRRERVMGVKRERGMKMK